MCVYSRHTVVKGVHIDTKPRERKRLPYKVLLLSGSCLSATQASKTAQPCREKSRKRTKQKQFCRWRHRVTQASSAQS